MRRSLLIWCLLLAGIICIAQSERVSAFWQSRGSNYNVAISGGGGSCSFPTLTTTGATVVGRWNALPANVTQSGGNITVMTDLSGNGHNMGNNNTVAYSTNGYNGHPALNLLAANSSNMSASSVGLSSNDYFMFIVGTMETATATFGGMLSFGVAGQNDFNGVDSLSAIARTSTTNSITLVSGNITQADNAISLSTHYRISQIGSITGSDPVAMYINNSAVTGSVFNNVTNNLGPVGTVVVGGRWLNGVDFTAWEGLVTEVIVGQVTDINGLSSTDRNAIDTYLTCQWGT